MADYMSPNPFMTPDNFTASGTAGGFLAGQNQAVVQQMLNRNFISQDLQNQIDSYKAQLAGAQLPGQEAQAQNNLSNQQAIGANWQPGPNGEPSLNAQNINTGVAANIGKNVASQYGSTQSINTIRANTLAQMGNMIQQNGGSLDPNNPQDQALNDYLVKKAASVGITFDNNQIDSGAAQKLVQIAQKEGLNSIKHQQTMAEITAQTGAKEKVAETNKEARAASDAAKLEQERLKGQFANQRAAMFTANSRSAQLNDQLLTQAIMSKDPATLTQSDMDMLLEVKTQAHFSDKAATDLAKMETQFGGDSNPNAYSEAINALHVQAQKEALADIMSNPTLKKLYQETRGKTGASSVFAGGAGNPLLNPTAATGGNPFSAATAGVQEAAGMKPPQLVQGVKPGSPYYGKTGYIINGQFVPKQ